MDFAGHQGPRAIGGGAENVRDHELGAVRRTAGAVRLEDPLFGHQLTDPLRI